MNDSLSKPRILFTTSLSAENAAKIRSAPLKTSCIPFISFEYPEATQWIEQVQSQPEKGTAWIFTSKRAVKALKPALPKLKKAERIFAVGPKTAGKLKESGLIAEIPESYNVEALSRFIVESDISRGLHFCGNLRSDTLKKKLGENDIGLKDVVVYRTVKQQTEVNSRDFDGIVFMSPSTVEAFLSVNQVGADTQVFCIGPTTRKAAEDAGISGVITPPDSTFDHLLKTIQNYYS